MAGSVKKDGKSWYYILELGKDINGKRKQKKKRGFKTKKEALIALTNLEHSLHKTYTWNLLECPLKNISNSGWKINKPE